MTFDPAAASAAATMRLYALDVHVADEAILVDEDKLRAVLYAGARCAGARVVGEAFHVFPNGAVTGVLLLAQSHVSIHTWPELALANVDLLTYGDVDAEAALRLVADRLGATASTVTEIARGRR